MKRTALEVCAPPGRTIGENGSVIGRSGESLRLNRSLRYAGESTKNIGLRSQSPLGKDKTAVEFQGSLDKTGWTKLLRRLYRLAMDIVKGQERWGESYG